RHHYAVGSGFHLRGEQSILDTWNQPSYADFASGADRGRLRPSSRSGFCLSGTSTINGSNLEAFTRRPEPSAVGFTLDSSTRLMRRGISSGARVAADSAS